MSEEAIQMFREVVGLYDEEEIRARVKANSNDAQAAIIDYYEGSPKYEAAKNSMNWDEAAFGTSRDGTEVGQATSFRIDAMGDDIGHGGPSVAPSRPPSRVNNRTPISNGVPGNVEAWQKDQTDFWQNPQESSDATGHNLSGAAADEDADLKRAIAASRAEAGMPPQEQETGVVNVNEVHFGPANRPDKEYETGQWDVVPSNYHEKAAGGGGPVGSSSTAVYEEPATCRVRTNGGPAFLLSNGADKLPQIASVITILHEIPAARNTLLRVGQPAAKYFHHPTWWRGTPVEYPPQEVPLDPKQEAAEEIHRLVAFLDNTDRSYGCIDPLLATGLLQGDSDPLRAFASAVADNLDGRWRNVLFTKFVRHFRVQNPEWDVDDDSEADTVALVDFPASSYSGDGFPPITGLYDILNMVMWHQFILPPQEDDDQLACISSPGQVIIFRWDGDPIKYDIEVPDTICMDRYLWKNKEVALSIQEGIAATAARLAALRKLKDSIYNEHLPNQKVVSRVEHLTAMIERCRVKLASIDEDAAWRAADTRWKASRSHQPNGIQPTDEEIDPEAHKPRLTEDEEKRKKFWANELEAFESSLERCKRTIKNYEEIQMFYEGVHSLVTDRCIGTSPGELETLLNSIKKQLSGAVGGVSAERAVAHFEELYPGVLDVDSWNDPEPTCKRFLRGVAVADRVVYVCRNIPDPAGEPERQAKWWKLEYREDETEPVKAEMVDETTVLMAAGKTQNRPILVYASEEAITQQPDAISEGLAFFVKSDNKIFHNEVANEVPTAAAGPSHHANSSTSGAPTKRKYSCCSMDSAATNRASAGDGSDVGNATANPFATPDDREADRDLVSSARHTPSGGVSSAVETEFQSGEAVTGARRRKTSPSSTDVGESSHVEYRDGSQDQVASPEMQSRDSMPMIGIGAGGNTAGNDGRKPLSRQVTAGVDMVNMEVHEHDDNTRSKDWQDW